MGQRQTLYQNYLTRWNEQHPDVVQPAILPLASLGSVERVGGSGKYHTSSSCVVYRVADGRMAEMCCTTSGAWRDDAVAVFPNEEARQAYVKPEGMLAYFGMW